MGKKRGIPPWRTKIGTGTGTTTLTQGQDYECSQYQIVQRVRTYVYNKMHKHVRVAATTADSVTFTISEAAPGPQIRKKQAYVRKPRPYRQRGIEDCLPGRGPRCQGSHRRNDPLST